MKKFRKNKASYAIYLALIAVILAVLYYAINNFVLSGIFGSDAVGWLESAIFAIVLIFIYEFIFPRIRRKRSDKT